MDEKFDFTQGSILSKMIKFMVPVFGALVLQYKLCIKLKKKRGYGNEKKC